MSDDWPPSWFGAIAGDPEEPRELLGRFVRQVWIEWAREQDDPKPSWLLPWEELDDGQKEVDMRIGEKLFKAGQLSSLRYSHQPHQ